MILKWGGGGGGVGTPSRTMIIVNLDIVAYHVLFRHIQPYCGIFRTLCNSCIFRTLSYSKFQHIQNPRYIQNCVKAYSEGCVMLACCEPYHIQNFAIFRILAHVGPEAYSESCLYKHIQAYSGIFSNDSYNNINFLFFYLFNLTYFSTKLKKTCVS